ncbi:MAG: DUF2232 domain-containing protein [bacterium]
MKDRFVATALAVLLSVSLFFSGLFSWFTPVPLFYISRRYSLRWGGITLLLIALLLSGAYFGVFHYLSVSKDPNSLSWFSWLPGMAYYEPFGKKAVMGSVFASLTFFGSMGLILAWRGPKERRLASLAAWTWLGATFAAALVVVLFSKGHLVSLTENVTKYLGLALDQFISLNQAAGLKGEEIAFIEKNRQWIIGSFLRILPGVSLAAGLFLTWLNLVVCKRIFGAVGFWGEVQDFSLFRIPFSLVWTVIAALSLFLANAYLWQWEILSFALLNLFILVFVIYFFQGLAILSFYLVLKGISPWLRFLCYALLAIFLQPLGLLLAGLGFFDSWFNFRRLNVRSSS